MRGREFGDGVRAALASAGLSGRGAAELIGWDHAKLSDLINGKGGSTEVELGVLLGMLRVPPAERDHLLTLFRETNRKDWYQPHGQSHPIRPRTLVEHERKAIQLISWQLCLVHGLLQIPDYMRAVIASSATAPSRQMEERVAARLARQEVFRKGDLQATFYMHEQVLHVPIGGKAVLSEQLYHLLRMSAWSYISLRIVPTSVGAHAGLAGPFNMMKFEKYEPVVFLESENSSLAIEAADSVKGYEMVVKSLERTALDEEQSRGLITQLVT
ncbi:transcriptional regulator [Lentzea sp. NBRC 105346]|nr:transcriptional regulator [Lentzea sp. NBRC 105346]